ncbi:hypothetical protein [uncultured Erythrobacter sp.]|uniref:hypothetical protein n=1 Tax=uncultured Erythrobacter sp. TaxID=263913 RepID=UPI00265A71C3|nr:hypothetical protein [uncultured Erythrobacter sp.]
MTGGFDSYSSLGSVLDARFRGHSDRNWEEWRQLHYYETADQISKDAARAWVNRQKLNYRSISDKKALRHLISANVNQAFLEEIGKLCNLRRLELEWPFLGTDLTPLLALRRLEHLSIDSPRNLSDFSPLLALPSLRTLLITNAKRMTNVEWLSGAHHLEVIGIEGAIDSEPEIESLEPLAGLRSLRAFFGVSTRLADKRLTPLAQCPALEYVSIARCAPRSEFDMLHHAQPNLVCHWFDAEAWGTLGLKAVG